jgi:hypothetical protein
MAEVTRNQFFSVIGEIADRIDAGEIELDDTKILGTFEYIKERLQDELNQFRAEATWHPVSTKPVPGEYLVLYRSGRMMSASWMLTMYAPEGEWVDDWDGESIEDFEGQVVTHWRSLPAGVGEKA